ncbi:MepB family protein [Vagococcus sp. BWB3-3]|uniref:MepB family protein n=1 Tax=Vagococcus allomyrinae TaxID=2794353 RepID=A0A940PG42_9ENTE|nr:MepB family protein [Vagococcus allomyrinae]MBP1043982.1 MepB family protein [Vagococcus allomyrinae]
MTDFRQSLAVVQKELYQTLTPDKVSSESQNQEYGAGQFWLETTSVRYRVAKITPKKTGQFVAFWYKHQGKNTPYSATDSPDVLVVNTFTSERFGQFVFPKEELIRRGILSQEKPGKMAMRVYPVWDQPTSSQALATQKWQRPYFIEFGPDLFVDQKRLRQLYQLD